LRLLKHVVYGLVVMRVKRLSADTVQ